MSLACLVINSITIIVFLFKALFIYFISFGHSLLLLQRVANTTVLSGRQVNSFTVWLRIWMLSPLCQSTPMDCTCCLEVSFAVLFRISGIALRTSRRFPNWSADCSLFVHAVFPLCADTLSIVFLPGHDCSLRLWNMESRTCVQEMTSHRKKHDESIFSVAFHPSRGYFASGGADAIAKVFV